MKRSRVCNRCKSLHIKCDLSQPTCGQCSQGSHVCERQSKYVFTDEMNLAVAEVDSSPLNPEFVFRQNQPWPTAYTEIRFLPSRSLVDDDDNELIKSNLDNISDRSCNLWSPQPLESFEASSAYSDTDLEDQSSDRTELGRTVLGRDAALVRTGAAGQLFTCRRATPQGLSFNQAISEYDVPLEGHWKGDAHWLWPLETDDEAILIHHFATELSEWFDFCDRNRHFATTVLQAASVSPALLFAILAVSAKHFSLIHGFDSYAADRYLRKCLDILLPSLANNSIELDDKLLATTIIIRLFDEMTARTDDSHSYSHVLDAQVFARAPVSALSPSSMRSAAFIVHLRQDIFVAFMTSTTVPPLPEDCDIDRSLDVADDWVWTLRMIIHTADVVNYCNGDEPKTVANWEALMTYTEKWRELQPISFMPLFYLPEDSTNLDRMFPTIRLLNDCHIAGHQYYNICQLLLSVYNPRIPRIGLSSRAAAHKVEINTQQRVKIICGIALSNRHVKPAMVNAGMVVAMCGDRFTTRKEQENLYEILIEVEAQRGLSLLKSQRRLKQVWGWD
ncbi:hypothetical protein V1517DRAFT_334672 [Lipomyces orientalis]|uniref:Uncharacterized protein n=1 Tax=Lipomyces orientalis TaxID=1233043 RepID=A0ACC3TDL5_9ASCO